MLQDRRNRDFEWEAMVNLCLIRNNLEDTFAKLRKLHFTRKVYIISQQTTIP
jgi:hypothetical protein